MLKKLFPISVGIVALSLSFYFATQAGIPKDKQKYLFCSIITLGLFSDMVRLVIDGNEKV